MSLKHLLLFGLQPLLSRCPPACLGPFWVEYYRCGGVFRIATLLAIGRADANNDGSLDDGEFREYESRAGKLINETNTVMGHHTGRACRHKKSQLTPIAIQSPCVQPAPSS